MVILVLNKNTQTNTLALRGDREECIGTCLSLGSGPMTDRLTTQARNFSSRAEAGTQEL
jgi:hypothetical protein